MNACRGRFAPSPTGPLHFGSLVAAVASWCEARTRGGQWLLRIEDLDPPRCAPGAAEDILATLERLGLDWDGTPMRQSTRGAAYAAALERLADHVFPCACSRREIADSALNPQGEQVYPGTCRGGLPPGRGVRSSRLRVDECEIEFTDAVQGRIRQSLARDVGDFVLRRADGVFAYQLAVVVDDAEQGISHVVRGADLLASTPRQIYLQRLLGLPTPHYAHVPVALNAAGEKLSKQTLAEAIDLAHPAPALAAALAFLGQSPPPELARARARDLRDWALAHWSLERVPRVRALRAR